MSLVDLKLRATEDKDAFHKYKRSSDSLIYVEGGILLPDESPITMNLSIGSSYYKNGQRVAIPSDGLRLKPNESVVFETKQLLALPDNLFGIIFGIGQNIYNRHGFISTGKINPSFDGRLKIGYFNGSKSAVIFKESDMLACCSFIDCENTNLQSPFHSENLPTLEMNRKNRFKNWFFDNWNSFIAIIISLAALAVSIIKP